MTFPVIREEPFLWVLAAVLRSATRALATQLPNAPMIECAPGFVPFTRASSTGLAGKRTAACLRLEEPSSAGPCQAEQRSEPEGPRSRVPGGIAKGGRASGPLWLATTTAQYAAMSREGKLRSSRQFRQPSLGLRSGCQTSRSPTCSSFIELVPPREL